MSNFWYNYHTKEYDLLDDLPKTDGEAICLIPDDIFARSAYEKYRKSGRSIKEAMFEVLKFYVL